MFNVKRNPKNPIIQSDNSHPWRANTTFNCSPAMGDDDVLHLVYRATTDESLYEGKKLELSTIGHVTTTKDCQKFGKHTQLIAPQEEWERYGCEDPRVTKVGDTYYIFYTALGGFPFSADNIKCAVAITKDFKTIESRHLVTPFNAKAMTLFPEKVDGKWTVILTAHSDMPPAKTAFAQVDELEQLWDPAFWNEWHKNIDSHTIDLRRNDQDHIEVGATPVLTEDGWLLVYSHIQQYFSDKKIFGIEAVMLDRNSPRHVLGRTQYPFMVPEETYEQYGQIEDIIFPSGAMVYDDNLTVFYGAADTSCASASLRLSSLLEHMKPDHRDYVKRYSGNPTLLPIKEHTWESKYVLNPTAIDLGGDVHILYRAVGPNNTSLIGYAKSGDGLIIDERETQPAYVPRADFEKKLNRPDGNSGCEDARIVHIEDRLYITYTAYNGRELPSVAVSSISEDDFLNKQWNRWTMPTLITPGEVDDKDAAIFDRKIKGQYMVLHRIDHHVCADLVPDLNFEEHKLTRCIQMFGPRRGMWDSKKVGINGPPIYTEDGWLLFYHGINEQHIYCMGAALLDKDDPTVVIGRTAEPLMQPREKWEIEGWIPNVVFSCGQAVRDDTIYIYYGGADTVVGVATISQSKLLESLKS